MRVARRQQAPKATSALATIWLPLSWLRVCGTPPPPQRPVGDSQPGSPLVEIQQRAAIQRIGNRSPALREHGYTIWRRDPRTVDANDEGVRV
jgi:hypothetical protein